MGKPMISEIETQEKFKDIKMLAHNIKMLERLEPYAIIRLEKIVSICDEQIKQTDKIIDQNGKQNE
jgi:hypothetical protein